MRGWLAEERWGRTWGEEGETSDIKLIYKKEGIQFCFLKWKKMLFYSKVAKEKKGT